MNTFIQLTFRPLFFRRLVAPVFIGALAQVLALSAQAQAPAPPTTADSQLRVSTASCKWAKLAWTKGDGTYRALVLADLTKAANEGTSQRPDVAPAQGQQLSGTALFGVGGLSNNNGFAVYTDTGRVATVVNLLKGHQYMALLYPYNKNAASGEVSYLLSPAPDTLRFTTPACPDVSPTVAASRLRAQGVDCSTLTLTCHPGNGQARLFVIRKSGPTFSGDVSVPQESYLFPSNLYARGLETSPQSACYAVAAGTDSTVTVYALAPDVIYKWAVYEFNTVPGPTGVPDGFTPFFDQNNVPVGITSTPRCTGGEPGKSTVDDKPHQTSNALVVPGSLRSNSVTIQWHPSVTPAHYLFGNSGPIVPAGPQAEDGAGSYVIINNALTPNLLPIPLQNTGPAASSLVYGRGSPVRPGQDSVYSVKVAYGATDTLASISGLRPNTSYTVNVFTFRFPDSGPNLASPFTYFLSQPQAVVFFTTPATPLPVSLVRFGVSHRPGSPTVQLSWQTASELNNAGFGIERSLDGRVWVRLSFVASLAGTSTQAQHYVAFSPFVGLAYYRLRQQDFSGWATYSPICFIADESVAGSGRLRVYPNPTPTEFTLSGADPSQPLNVYDTLGRLVLHLPAGSRGGSLESLAAGVYVLRQGSEYTRLTRP